MFDNYTLGYKMFEGYNELICLKCNNKTINVPKIGIIRHSV